MKNHLEKQCLAGRVLETPDVVMVAKSASGFVGALPFAT